MLSVYLFDKRHGRWSTIAIILPPVGLIIFQVSL
jgi:hypothetical protein